MQIRLTRDLEDHRRATPGAMTVDAFLAQPLVASVSYLSDDAELIIAELVGNAVRHGLRATPQIRRAGASPSALRLCLLRRVGEVMLAVTDPSDDAPKPKAPSDSGESGRGTRILQR